VHPSNHLVVLPDFVVGAEPACLDQLRGTDAQVQVPAARQESRAVSVAEERLRLLRLQDKLAAEPADFLENQLAPAGELNVQAFAGPTALELPNRSAVGLEDAGRGKTAGGTSFQFHGRGFLPGRGERVYGFAPGNARETVNG